MDEGGDMKIFLRSLFIAALLSACSTFSPSEKTPSVQPALTAPEATSVVADGDQCQHVFASHELKKPYNGTGERFTLSTEDLEGYLKLSGVRSLCIPPEYGAPFINADWDSAKMPATGRMVSLGFENLYHGAGWSDIFLVYSTYDFKFGTEYDRFASTKDRDALRSHQMAGEIEVDGKAGFVRFYPSMFGYEDQPQIFYKTWVFPFENDYVAVVYNLGAYEGDTAGNLARLESGFYPDGRPLDTGLFDQVAGSIRFSDSK